MIILNVHYKCKPGKRDEFRENLNILGVPSKTRAEDGCLGYDYYLPVDNDDELLLIERWRDAEALASHGTSAHCVELQPVKQKYITETIINKFVI